MRSIAPVLVVLVLGLAAAAGPADAGWDGAIECRHGTQEIQGNGAVTLGGPLACEVVVDDFDPADLGADLVAQLWVIQDGRDGEPTVFAGAFVSEPEADFFEFATTPTRGRDFAGCAPFVVHAQIVKHDDRVLWSGTRTINARCGKPKKLKASFGCAAEVAGTTYRYPGSGAKAKPMLQGTVACTVAVTAKQVRAGETLAAQLQVGDQPWRSPEALVADAGAYRTPSGFALTASGEPGAELLTCTTATVSARLVDQDARVRWTGAIKIAQDCGEP